MRMFIYSPQKRWDKLGFISQIPSREIYHKGHGLILPRSPEEFITEVQMMLASSQTLKAEGYIITRLKS